MELPCLIRLICSNFTNYQLQHPLHRRNGSYALLEVKLGVEDHINAGAASMIELARNIDTDKMPAPSFMAVIIGVGQYAYQRQDGVYVIPIGCLKD